MNKIYLWEGDYNLIYPSLFIFDRILTLEDSSLDFACTSVLDFARSSGLPLETIIDLIKDKTINPIIMYTDRDEMQLCYDLLCARSKKEARKIGSLVRATYDIYCSDEYIDHIMSFPKKTREQLSEVVAPSENYTRSYYFVEYHPQPLRGEKKILKKFREANKIANDVSGLMEKYMQRSGYGQFDAELMSELVNSTTIAKVFHCSVVEDNAHLKIYRELLTQLEDEIKKTPELKKILLETNKISAFKEVLNSTKLRIPNKLAYSKIKRFRKDSAHRNLSKWLTMLYRSVREEEAPPTFDETIILEIEELTRVLQDEIKKDSLVTTATLTAFASYLATLHPAAILAVVSSLVSYIPLTYVFTRLYRGTGPNNFVFYFVNWRKPPIGVR